MQRPLLLLSALVAATTALPLTAPANQTPSPQIVCPPKNYTTLLFPGGFNDTLPNYVEVKVNGSPYLLLVDTGSPDTFLYADNVTCVGPAFDERPQSNCTFGRTLGQKLAPIEGVVFNQTYASTTSVAGHFSMVNFEIAGLNFQQQIGVAQRANPNSYPAASGILGLGTRSLEGAYNGKSFIDVNRFDKKTYSTVFETMSTVTKQVTGVFSLAVQRGPVLGGYLTFGGLPPVNSTDFTAVKFQGIRNISDDHSVSSAPATLFYPVQPDGMELDGKYSTTNYTAYIDSGAPSSALPKDLIAKIAALYKPAATLLPGVYGEAGIYGVHCNATAPSIGLKLGGKTFYFNKQDLIGAGYKGICTIPFQPFLGEGKPGLQSFVIGNQFLKSVVAQFDPVNEEVRLASHNYTVNTGLQSTASG